MAEPLIFISHSTLDKAVAEAIASRLRATGFATFLDTESIGAGADWALDIEQGMLNCHGALFLLSENAKTAAWVSHEAFLLAVRRRQLAVGSVYEFPIITLLMGGFTPEDLDQPPFKAARLSQWQAYAIDTENIDLGPAIKVFNPLKQAAARRAIWEDVLLPIVSVLESKESSIVYIAGQIGLQLSALNAGRECSRLACALCHLPLAKLETVVKGLAAISPDNRNAALVVLRYAGPICWVDKKAVHALALEACRQPPPRKKALHLNSHYRGKKRLITSRLYVNRASMALIRWHVIECGSYIAKNELIQEIRQSLSSHLGISGILDDDDEGDFFAAQDEQDYDLREKALTHIAEEGPILVLLPYEFGRLDEQLLEELMAEFDYLTFLICTDEIESDSLAHSKKLFDVQPLLEKTAEDAMHQTYNRLGASLAVGKWSDLV